MSLTIADLFLALWFWATPIALGVVATLLTQCLWCKIASVPANHVLEERVIAAGMQDTKGSVPAQAPFERRPSVKRHTPCEHKFNDMVKDQKVYISRSGGICHRRPDCCGMKYPTEVVVCGKCFG